MRKQVLAPVSSASLEVSDSERPDRLQTAPVASTSRATITWTSVILGFAALLLFSAGITRPSEGYWDENMYVGVSRALSNGSIGPIPSHFSDASLGRQHPPLGSLLIATGIQIFGDNPLGWRMPSVVCGALTLVAVFLWAYVLLSDYGLALTAALLTLFNNFLFVMSRIAMLDAIEFMLVIWGVLTFTVVVKCDCSMRRMLMVASGLFFGLAAACKWNAVFTGLTMFVAGFALWSVSAFKFPVNERFATAVDNIREVGLPVLIAAFTIVPVVAYVAVCLPFLHVAQRVVSVHEFIRWHSVMLTLTREAPGNPTLYASWYSWPFRVSPQRGLSYLVGNYVVMWGGLAALAVCLRRWRKAGLAEVSVLLLYLANVLPWAVMPLKVPNYYYYYSASMFLAVAIAIVLKHSSVQKMCGARLSLIVLLGAFSVFLYCYPQMAHLQAPWDCMFGCWP